MDTFDNNNNELPREDDLVFPQPPQEVPEVPQETPSTYSGAGAGRKESPYANSPYVMQEPAAPEYHYQPQAQPPKQKKEKKSGKGTARRIAAVLLTIALVAGGCFATAYSVNQHWEARTQEMMAEMEGKIAALEEQLPKPAEPGYLTVNAKPVPGAAMTPSQLYANCVDSVVAISSTVQTRDFYGVSEGTSSGSGFVLSADGYIVTNYHVIEGAVAIDVILHGGEEHPATVVGSDSAYDLAVLKIDAQGLMPAALGKSSDLNIGDMVVAIGNPLGELAATQTVGYVSGVGREVTTDNTIISMIQTDAAINPGNSGGPLFNAYGQVIGITTAKYSGTTSSGATIEGIGFAIPIDDILRSMSDIVDYGYVTGAYLGVTVQNVDAASAAVYNLPTGAYVVSVVEGGSADRAGVKPEDIITELGGHEVNSITDLTRALRNFKANDTTTITVLRSGKEVVLDITLDEKPQDFNAAAPQGGSEMPDSGSYDEWYDFFFGPNGG